VSRSVGPDNTARNRLLAGLPSEEQMRLQPHLEPVPLALREILYAPNTPISFVFFPLDGVCSLLSIDDQGEAVEVATVGNEGFVGLPVFLGATATSGQAVSQVPGRALRMGADVFRSLVTPGTPLHDRLQRYTEALFNMVAQGAACNRLHSITQRCARWLLLTQDRVGADTFPLTHEFLAKMLGVRPASVSDAARALQSAGLISYRRGIIRVADRPGLEAASCSCYAIIRREFERMLA
jgi:CRP-like cAMP-binding protein